ncbi:MAG: hypothetical protein EOP45_14530 [Sphingobacteriaceae bacterium]|nr:MAG: hypothetical protein EOP45_14530 [Sphingobacteriaceae bacterium]
MKLFTACVMLFCACVCQAQQDSVLTTLQENVSIPKDTGVQGIRIVKGYIITGAKRTKDYMVEREFAFEAGKTYSIPDLLNRLETTRQQLMNTALFVSVTLKTVDIAPEEVNVLVDVKERWYLFPLPYFKLIDRNLNQRWVEQKRSLNCWKNNCGKVTTCNYSRQNLEKLAKSPKHHKVERRSRASKAEEC